MIPTEKNIKTEQRQALLQYCLVCVISFIGSMIIACFLSKGSLLDIGEQITLHFSAQFSKNAPLYNFIISVLYYSIVDIICIISVFLFTFSIFNYLASDVVLLYQGLNIGLSISILLRYSSLFNSISIFDIIWFIGCKSVLLIFYIIYLNTLTKYSFELKSYSANLRVSLNFKTLLYLLIFMISGCGFALLLNAIYCLGIIIL